MDLGRACGFVVLAGSGITNTGPTSLSGNLGSSPTNAQSGFGTLVLSGTNHGNDAGAADAKTDLALAYADAQARTSTATLPTELGATTVLPGVFHSAAGTFSITGTLTLDGGGDSGAVFIFQCASTLVTAAGSGVSLANGAQAKNVFWAVGSSATLGASNSFQGGILALTSISLGAGSSLAYGMALAINGTVTLDSNTAVESCQNFTPTPSPSATPTETLSATRSASQTGTPSFTETAVPSATFTPSKSPTKSSTPTPTGSATASHSPTVTSSATESRSPTSTSSASGTHSPTLTGSPTRTHSPTLTGSPTLSSSPTRSESPTPSSTATETGSETPTSSPTQSKSQTPTRSPTPSSSATSTQTPPPSPTLSVTATFTLTASPSSSATETLTPSPSSSPSASPSASMTASPTPQVPGLGLSKSAWEAGAYLGSRVHYSLVLSNAGPGSAMGVQVYDTLPAGANFAGPGVVLSESYAFNDAWRFTEGLALARGPFDLAPGQSVTLSLAVDVVLGNPGENLTNTAQAVDAFFGQLAVAEAAIPLLAGAASPTPTPTAAPLTLVTPSPTQSPAPFSLDIGFVRDQGQAWLGGTSLRFSINLTHTAGAAVNDLVLLFHSDIENDNQFLDFLEPNTLLGPNDPMSPVAWRLVSQGIDTGVDLGTLSLPAGSSLASPRRIFATVMGGEGSTLTSRVVVSSAAFGTSVSATVKTYIDFGPPSTPIPSAVPSLSPTPLAGSGSIVPYPQPAKGRLCFAYHAPGPGPLQIMVYNSAFELVAEFKAQAQGGRPESSCAELRGLAPGLYLFQAKVGAFAFPMGRFGIAR